MAKEYIERDALCESLNARLKQLRDDYGDYDHYTDGFEECIDRIDDLLAADVVEVVRCKDCKHWVFGLMPYCGHPHGLANCGDQSYCSIGERRDA